MFEEPRNAAKTWTKALRSKLDLLQSRKITVANFLNAMAFRGSNGVGDMAFFEAGNVIDDEDSDENEEAEPALEVDRQHTRQIIDLQNAVNCIVCMVNPREVLLLNCKHLVLCVECCTRLEMDLPFRCPVCRLDVTQTIAAVL